MGHGICSLLLRVERRTADVVYTENAPGEELSLGARFDVAR